MESVALASLKFPVLVASPNPSDVVTRRLFPAHPSLPPLPPARRRRAGAESMRLGAISCAFDHNGSLRRSSRAARQKFESQDLASISSSNSGKGEGLATRISTPPIPPPPSSSSYIGSPLLWIGVGVGLSVLFQVVSAKAKRYVLQQTFKTMMDQAAPQSAQFNSAPFAPGSGFFIPPAPPITPTVSPRSSPPPVSSKPVANIDIQAAVVEPEVQSQIETQTDKQESRRQQAFVDISPEELFKDDLAYSKESTTASDVEILSEKEVSSNGTFKPDGRTPGEGPQQRRPILSVEALEKMMEDPTVQKMVYPYIPEELRNPTSFKWLMQNPQFRQQMQDMLSNMGGNGEWDNRLMDSLKNFDLSSPEVKQQFEQIGLTPEEVISKILANPDVAMAFQNPKVQAAILDISQNPMNIAKYQHDKEVMDVLNKISELFPGIPGQY